MCFKGSLITANTSAKRNSKLTEQQKSGQGPERADFSICQELIQKRCEPMLLLIRQLPGTGRTQEGGPEGVLLTTI